MSSDVRRADEVFTVTTSTDGSVRFVVTSSTVDIEMDLPPESALWLAHELVKAARLPYPPPLRLTRRKAGDAS